MVAVLCLVILWGGDPQRVWACGRRVNNSSSRQRKAASSRNLNACGHLPDIYNIHRDTLLISHTLLAAAALGSSRVLSHPLKSVPSVNVGRFENCDAFLDDGKNDFFLSDPCMIYYSTPVVYRTTRHILIMAMAPANLPL